MSGNRKSIRVKNYDYIQAGVYYVTVCAYKNIRRGASRSAPTVKRKPLGRLIGAFKTVSTKQINIIIKTPGARLWQHNFYEHIVRDEFDLNRIREYSINNPVQWADDEDYSV